MYLDQKGIWFDSQALPRFTTKGHSWKALWMNVLFPWFSDIDSLRCDIAFKRFQVILGRYIVALPKRDL